MLRIVSKRSKIWRTQFIYGSLESVWSTSY